MARLDMVKVTVFAALLIFGHSGRAQGAEGFAEWIDHLPGYSAQLPLNFCKSTFQHHKVLSRNVNGAGLSGSFNLFTFTMRPFNPQKPSIVTIHGGPGGLWSAASALEVTSAFSDFNVVFFHYRGGGCSDFRNTSKAWDVLLTSDGVVEDMEAIRNAYGISQWKAVMGFSYGTNIARRYSRLLPSRVGLLVLEGLSIFDESNSVPDDKLVEKLLSSINKRLQTSSMFSTFKPDGFLSTLRDYFKQVSPTDNFLYAAAWDKIKRSIEESYKKSGQKVPKHVSLSTFLAVTSLMYAGESGESDVAILMLLEQFDYVHVDADFKKHLDAYWSAYDKAMFPFKYSDYADQLVQRDLVSWRVQLKMIENDKNMEQESLCTSQPMIVLNGTKDLATPIENTDRYLKNKQCSRASNTALIVEGGGHSNLTSIKCLTAYVGRVLNGQEPSLTVNGGCTTPVTVKTY